MKQLRALLSIAALATMPAVFADEITDACAALVISYAQHRDNYEANAFANLFTENGTLIIGNDRWEGRDEIRARIEALNSDITIRHHMSSIRITHIDENHASGVSYAVIYSSPPGTNEISGPSFIGDYLDQYVKTDEGWKISRRELISVFNYE